MIVALALTMALSASQTAAQEQFRADQRAAAARLAQHRAVEPADWSCADPLIQRNYQSRDDRGVVYPVSELSARIADECARPYAPRPISSDADRIFEAQERTIYGYQRSTFGYEITAKIEQARRRDRIRLN